MVSKRHFFGKYNRRINGISAILKSSVKPLKFSGSSHYDMPTKKYSMYIKCRLLNLAELLPLGSTSKLDKEDECIDGMGTLKAEYNSLMKISQVDCINIKQNVDEYNMYLVW